MKKLAMLTLVAFAVTGGPVDDAEAKRDAADADHLVRRPHRHRRSTLRIVCVRIA